MLHGRSHHAGLLTFCASCCSSCLFCTLSSSGFACTIRSQLLLSNLLSRQCAQGSLTISAATGCKLLMQHNLGAGGLCQLVQAEPSMAPFFTVLHSMHGIDCAPHTTATQSELTCLFHYNTVQCCSKAITLSLTCLYLLNLSLQA